MKILFDEGVPLPLRQHFLKNSVDTVQAVGWSGKSDNEILRLAEADGYGCLVTTDKNIVRQQNIANRTLKIYSLPTTSWPKLQASAAKIVAEVEALLPGRANLGHDPVDD